MKFSCTCLGVLIGAALALSVLSASATDLRPLSEDEMAGVYGRGLAEPTAAAFGALSTQEQGNSYASAGDPFVALGTLSTEGAKGLERQLAQQQLQTATTGLQATLKLSQTLATVSTLLGPVTSLVLPVMPFPLLFALPTLPAMPGNGGKH